MRVEDFPYLYTSIDDAETFKRIHAFPFNLHSMTEEYEVQSSRDDASFGMKLNFKETSHGVCDKHSMSLCYNSEPLQAADDKEENDLVVIHTHILQTY